MEWEALTSMADANPPEVPKITKNNPPLRWTDAFIDYCLNTFGVRHAPLAYMIRENIDILPETLPEDARFGEIDPLVEGEAYGNGRSIYYYLISHLSHMHPLFSTDNVKVYSALEKATRGIAYSSTVKDFSRRHHGRAAWITLISSHAGSEKWETLQK